MSYSSSAGSNSGYGFPDFIDPQAFSAFMEQMQQNNQQMSQEDMLYELINNPESRFAKEGLKISKEYISEICRWQGRPFPKDEMLRRHREQRQNIIEQQKLINKSKNYASLNMDLRNPYYPIKPDTEMGDPATYTRICIRDLTLNITHKNKVLRGRIIELPVVVQGLHSIIEDYNKDVLQVSIYNTGIQDVNHADSLFKVGYEIAVYDPFFKAYTHGGAGVRVEKPKEIYVGPPRDGLDKIDFRAQGNAFYKSKNFDKALECYSQGLAQFEEVSKLLANIAACLIKLEQAVPAVAYCCASVRIDNAYVKGWQRLLHALDICGKHDELEKTKSSAPQQIQSQLSTNIKAAIDFPKPAMWTFISSNIDDFEIQNIYDLELHVGLSSIGFDALKAKGNSQYKDLNYTWALQNYLLALQYKQDEVAMLLSNRAMCELQLGQFKDATYDATASLLIKYKDNEKAAYRRVQALRNTGKIKTAMRVLNGERLYRNEPLFQTLKEELKAMKKSQTPSGNSSDVSSKKVGSENRPSSKQQSDKSTSSRSKSDTDVSGENDKKGTSSKSKKKSKQQWNQRYPINYNTFDKSKPAREDMVNTLLDNESSTGDQLQEVIRMLEMLEPEKAEEFKKATLDTRVPNFYDEYVHGGHTPVQCDLEACRKWVSTAYMESRMSTKRLNHMKPQIEKEGPESFIKSMSMDILRRLGTNEQDRWEWWLKAPMEDVNLMPKYNLYPKDMTPNFTTSWHKIIDVTFGTRHVAVGYLDLGHLLYAAYRGDPANGPVQVYGYEQSAYCTAKSTVIAHMMRHNSPPQCVLQVWYSSGWSRETLKQFRSSLSELINHRCGPCECGYQNKDVIHIFKHWLKAPEVSLLNSQKTWLQYHPRHMNLPANFLRKRDRIDLISYMLTGRLLDCDVGSVVMFSNPSSVPHMCYDEYITDQLRESILMEHYNQHGSFMKAVIGRMLDGISQLIDKMVKELVVVILRYKEVSPTNIEVQREIQTLNPYTMFWSNLVDYYQMSDFHKMVRACSGKNTLHHMYSMNWVRDVKGASCMDYSFDFQLEMIEVMRKDIQEGFQKAGLSKVLLTPPANHPWNEGDSGCAGQLYKKWTDLFFQKGGVKQPQVGVNQCEEYSLFSCSKGNIFFCYSYNEEVSFTIKQPGEL